MSWNRKQWFWSYFKDILVHEFSSIENGNMKLLISSGHYKLVTTNAIYSFGKKYTSFDHAFQKLQLYENRDIKEVLVLGWAMGSIATLLSKHMTIQKITGVEHDKALVEVYKSYCKDQHIFDVEVRQADAIRFISHDIKQYDLICSDIFVDNVSPDEIISIEYLTDIDSRLAKNGMALISKLNRTTTDTRQNKILEENLKTLVGDFKCIRTLGNSIYWWQK